MAETADAISQGSSSHQHHGIWSHGSKLHVALSISTRAPSGVCSSSQAARGTPPGADGASSGAASSYGSCPVYGRHIECGTGDGQPQPRVLAARVQVTAPPPTSAPRHITLVSYSLTPDSAVVSHRVTEFISSLEHTHFSDGSLQPPSLPTITQQGDAVDLGLELSAEYSSETAELGSSQPVMQPLSIQELLREGGRGGRSMVDLKSGSLMSGSSAAKAVCLLSTQADRCEVSPSGWCVCVCSAAV